jgi:uncharacterized protein
LTKHVLVAALSGRALGACARRAGFTPLIVDAFGDEDTRASARAYRGLPEAIREGFRARVLIPALEALAAEAPEPPVGLVLGSGFEDTPKLIAALARRFRLLGNDAATIARTKDPAAFFPLLDTLAVAHPETSLSPPSDPEEWLSKRIGGSGGAHVIGCSAAAPRAGRYYQRRIAGDPVSLLAVAQRDRLAIAGFTRQWTVGTAPRPYRYGGAVGPAHFNAKVEARMIATAETVSSALGLIGLVSFDFLLADGISFLLEVNPRPGATLDLLDDDQGALFTAHLAACQGGVDPLPLPPSGARAAAILYADQGPLVAEVSQWPAWTADRPGPGTRIPRHRPVATVFADGDTATAAELNCRGRLDELALMLYGRAPDTERNNAKTHRPRRERVGASS